MPNRTFYQCKIEKKAYEPLTAVLSTLQDTLYRKLFKKGKVPPGMVHVDGFMHETAGNYSTEKHNFFIDKFEVTNKEFKKFVDNQGYNNPGYWKHEFILEGKTLSWEEAIVLFKDNTGRPGPATWEASDYPEGQGDYPVNGISWYEAAAYAEFVGKELPTLWHWDSAMGKYIDHINRSFPPYLFPLSNMKYKGTHVPSNNILSRWDNHI